MHRLPQVGDVVSLQPYASSEWIVSSTSHNTYHAYNADTPHHTCSWSVGHPDATSDKFIPLAQIELLDTISPSKASRQLNKA